MPTWINLDHIPVYRTRNKFPDHIQLRKVPIECSQKKAQEEKIKPLKYRKLSKEPSKSTSLNLKKTAKCHCPVNKRSILQMMHRKDEQPQLLHLPNPDYLQSISSKKTLTW